MDVVRHCLRFKEQSTRNTIESRSFSAEVNIASRHTVHMDWDFNDLILIDMKIGVYQTTPVDQSCVDLAIHYKGLESLSSSYRWCLIEVNGLILEFRKRLPVKVALQAHLAGFELVESYVGIKDDVVSDISSSTVDRGQIISVDATRSCDTPNHFQLRQSQTLCVDNLIIKKDLFSI